MILRRFKETTYCFYIVCFTKKFPFFIEDFNVL